MAGDRLFVKMALDLERKPAVLEIASQVCDSAPHASHVVCDALRRVWAHARKYGDQGIVRRLRISHVDQIADLPGLGEAMRSVGWLQEVEGGIQFVNYHEWNSPKTSAEKMSDTRGSPSGHISVTSESHPSHIKTTGEGRGKSIDLDLDLDLVLCPEKILAVRERANRLFQLAGFAADDQSLPGNRRDAWKASYLVEVGQISEAEFADALESVRHTKRKNPAAYWRKTLKNKLHWRGANLNALMRAVPEPPDPLDGGEDPWTETKP